MGADDTNEYAVAINAITGEERWRHVLDLVYKDGMGGNGPRSTPTVLDDLVVVFGANGKLAALDKDTGEPRWTRDVATEEGGRAPQWGYSASPLVHDGRVFVDIAGGKDKGLLAVDLSDGVTAWTSGDVKAGYSSPVAVEVDGTTQVVFLTGKTVVAAAPSDGRVLWERPWKAAWDVNAAAPLFVGPNHLLLSSSSPVGAGLLELSTTDGVTQTKELWTSKAMKNKMSTSVVVGDVIYGFNESRLAAVSLHDGEAIWNTIGLGRGSLLLADDHLVVLSEDGRLGLAQATPEAYTEVREPMQVMNSCPCWTAPSLANGVLYLRDQAEIVALDLRVEAAAAPVAPQVTEDPSE